MSDATSTTVASVRGLHRRPSDRGALHGITLELRRGDFIAVMGRPGAGKSTLLRAIAGEDRSTGSGELTVADRRTTIGPVVPRGLPAGTDLVLADDPFAGQDPATRARMHLLLRTLYEASRPAVLLVTHDVDEALALTDRVLVLEAGRIRSWVAVPRARRGSEQYDDVRALLVREIGQRAARRAATA